MHNRAIVFIIITFFLLLVSCSQKQKFNSEKWKQCKDYKIGDKCRYNMVDDFVKSKIWMDKKKMEIIELLGEDHLHYSEWNISYEVYTYYGNIDPTYVTVLELYFKDGYCTFAEHRVTLDRR